MQDLGGAKVRRRPCESAVDMHEVQHLGRRFCSSAWSLVLRRSGHWHPLSRPPDPALCHPSSCCFHPSDVHVVASHGSGCTRKMEVGRRLADLEMAATNVPHTLPHLRSVAFAFAFDRCAGPQPVPSTRDDNTTVEECETKHFWWVIGHVSVWARTETQQNFDEGKGLEASTARRTVTTAIGCFAKQTPKSLMAAQLLQGRDRPVGDFRSQKRMEHRNTGSTGATRRLRRQ